VPVPVNTLSNVGTVGIQGTAAVQASIEYKKVVLQLELLPLINSEKEVSLDILQKLDSIVPNGGQLISAMWFRQSTPSTSYQRFCSEWIDHYPRGLIQEQKQKQYQGIPYLSRIPLIGAAFRGTANSKQRQELIILMCPQVTLTKLDQYRLRQKSEGMTHFGPELDQNECQDCPKRKVGKQLALPRPIFPRRKICSKPVL